VTEERRSHRLIFSSTPGSDLVPYGRLRDSIAPFPFCGRSFRRKILVGMARTWTSPTFLRKNVRIR
jgi:hypothetical protein